MYWNRSRLIRTLAVFAPLAAWVYPPNVAGQTVGDPLETGRSAAGSSTESTIVTGITKPHRAATLAALQTAHLVTLRTQEGSIVPAGEVLVVLDDGVQRVKAEMAKADAESTAAVESARVSMEQAERNLARVKKLSGGDYATDKELQDAQTEAEITRLAYAAARTDHEQAQRKYEYERLLLDRLMIRAPFGGYVAETLKEIGETVEEGDPVIRLVALHPLEVVVDCPIELVHSVKVGDRITVSPVDNLHDPRVGEVFFANRVADPASQTFRVKLLIENQDSQWIAGLKVRLDFGQATAGRSAPAPQSLAQAGGAATTPPVHENTTQQQGQP